LSSPACAAHSLNWLAVLQVRFQEAVDKMIRQIVRQLWEAEQRGGCLYSIVVTGDHSTPVVFGDHSHEPVPFAIAHIRDVVRCELALWQCAQSAGLSTAQRPTGH
jgi:2,3-bisphosphoglycerate-independent phosphoglycerate mutase